MSRQQTVVDSAATQDAQERVWDAFRRWGYLQANLDPLGDMAPVAMPELEVTGHGSGSRATSLLRDDRRGIHAHSRTREARMDSSAHGSGCAGSGSRANSGLAGARGNFRAGAADALSGNEALLAGGRSGAAAAAGRDTECVVRAGSDAGGAGDEPSRAAECDGPHRGTRSGGSVSRVSRMWTRAACWAAAT